MSDEPAVSLLLMLRLKAFVPTEGVIELSGLPAGPVRDELRQMVERGWVVHREGLAAGWSLTQRGRRRGEELLRRELAAAGSAERVLACYDAFLPLNAELLSICTDWQTVVVGDDHLPNPHTDPVRDAAVLDRLDRLHEAALPLLGDLAEAHGRFAPYPGRLSLAHERVRAGSTEWIARPSVDSYHGIWFELHEHLLVTLGRERVGEQPARSGPTPSPRTEYTSTRTGERT